MSANKARDSYTLMTQTIFDEIVNLPVLLHSDTGTRYAKHMG